MTLSIIYLLSVVGAYFAFRKLCIKTNIKPDFVMMLFVLVPVVNTVSVLLLGMACIINKIPDSFFRKLFRL